MKICGSNRIISNNARNNSSWKVQFKAQRDRDIMKPINNFTALAIKKKRFLSFETGKYDMAKHDIKRHNTIQYASRGVASRQI